MSERAPGHIQPENFRSERYPEEDKNNPEYASAMSFAAALRKKIYAFPEDPLKEEIMSLIDSFREQNKDQPKKAEDYRLFHYLIGSTPPDDIEAFDASGDDSLASRLERFSQEHGIEPGQV